MFMNKNKIEFDKFAIEFPRINETLSLILENIFSVIKKDIKQNNLYFIPLSDFGDMPFDEVLMLFKKNIQLSIFDKVDNSWYLSNVINDINIKENKIFFRPSSILYEILLKTQNRDKFFYTECMLLKQIRFKPTLLFLYFLEKQENNIFTLDVSELKKVLEIETHKYKNFNAFNVSVIARMIKEINEKTEYNVSYYANNKNNGKKIFSVSFEFSKLV